MISVRSTLKKELKKIQEMQGKIREEKKSHRLFLQKKLIKAEKSLVNAARDLKQLHMVV